MVDLAEPACAVAPGSPAPQCTRRHARSFGIRKAANRMLPPTPAPRFPTGGAALIGWVPIFADIL